ncbi:endolytic transglycosylase MltG [Candidatus Saccharibacteria bacterium]|nr:endolytic transglycosylase MltG [Candidatus Saccharibacteria bacterium]
MKLLGLDVGEKRIGVARADSSTRIAVPIGFINVDGIEWQEIAKLCRIHSTNCFVVGLPRSNEGNETAQSVYVRNFAKVLIEKIPGAKVRFQDESLTSVMAEERLKARRKAYEKGEIDAEAAAIILQDFMESFKNPRNTTDNTPPDQFSGSNPNDTSNTSSNTTQNVRSDIQSSEEGSERSQELTDTIKKETDKMKLKAKKTKHKMRTAIKVISVIVVILAIVAGATGGFLWYKQREEERARYWAELEAQQNADNVFSFTIRPGENIYEIKNNLIEVGYEPTEVDEAFNAPYDFAFLQGRPEGATLEGYLFGETHEFYKTDSVKDILTKYLQGMEQVITENNLEQRYAARGLSLYEGITLASVVQKESADAEMPTVAQVFLSRLAYGIPLGSDVTVTYALDTVDPDRQTYTDNQAALSVDSCYNTRLHAGLPCGPISNPGLAALLAVAEPTDTAYLYFLTGDDGLMYYSYTEAEHLQNAAAHCQSLCNVSL